MNGLSLLPLFWTDLNAFETSIQWIQWKPNKNSFNDSFVFNTHLKRVLNHSLLSIYLLITYLFNN